MTPCGTGGDGYRTNTLAPLWLVVHVGSPPLRITCPQHPPKRSLLAAPVSPLAQTGPSRVGSASFNIHLLQTSSGRGPSARPEASADAPLSPNTAGMQVDLQEISPEDA